MNKPAKLLLLYSLVVSIIIVTASTILNSGPQNWLLQTLFLPVPIYLSYTLITQIKRGKKEKSPPFKLTKNQVMGGLVILLILTGLGYTNIQRAENLPDVKNLEPNISQLRTSDSTSSADQSNEETTLVEVVAEEGAYVNVRRDPELTSRIIDLAENGDVFVSTAKNGLWYEVRLEKDTFGYIFGDYIKISDKILEKEL